MVASIVSVAFPRRMQDVSTSFNTLPSVGSWLHLRHLPSRFPVVLGAQILYESGEGASGAALRFVMIGDGSQAGSRGCDVDGDSASISTAAGASRKTVRRSMFRKRLKNKAQKTDGDHSHSPGASASTSLATSSAMIPLSSVAAANEEKMQQLFSALEDQMTGLERQAETIEEILNDMADFLRSCRRTLVMRPQSGSRENVFPISRSKSDVLDIDGELAGFAICLFLARYESKDANDE